MTNLSGVSIAMLGGDLRELELAKTLLEHQVDLRLVGYLDYPGLEKAKHYHDVQRAVSGVQAVIAPMSNTDLLGNVISRLDKLLPIDLTQVIPELAPQTPLLIGAAKPIIIELAQKYGIRVVETANVDEIAILNSIPTAEGAIQIAMEKLPITIHSARCLVVGFGRCGFTLARNLAALGAQVSVAARSRADLARITEMGLIPLDIHQWPKQLEYDVVFNTVPALIITEQFLTRLNPAVLIFDLAAAPGGVDFQVACSLGINAELTLSLPGKVAPITAGKILSKCIPRLLQEMLGGEADAT